MIVYIVSSRCGCEMNTPLVFGSKEDAKNYIKNEMYDLMLERSDEMEDDDVDTNNIDDVFIWGEENDYCTSYNDLGFPDTYTGESDWTEYMITTVDLSELISKS